MKWTLQDVIQQLYSQHASFLPMFAKIIAVLVLYCERGERRREREREKEKDGRR